MVPHGKSILDADIRTFFRTHLFSAAENQQVAISTYALGYVTEMLVGFHETARFFVQKEGRVPILVDFMSEALEADYHRRITIFRQLGDTSLMLSGYFPQSVTKRGMSLSYYQKMGEVAYSQLSSLSQSMNVFVELSERFQPLSSLINEVSEQTLLQNESLLKLLDYYRSTGSERILEKLKAKGILPIPLLNESESS